MRTFFEQEVESDQHVAAAWVASFIFEHHAVGGASPGVGLRPLRNLKSERDLASGINRVILSGRRTIPAHLGLRTYRCSQPTVGSSHLRIRAPLNTYPTVTPS